MYTDIVKWYIGYDLVHIFLNTIVYNVLSSPQSRKARKESFFYCFPLSPAN